jgi:type I restriction enzyme, S subunit
VKSEIEIPDGWERTKLEKLCDILDHKRIPIAKSKRVSGNIPYYGATGLLDYINDFIFDEELLLVGEDGADWSSFANTSYAIRGKSWVNNHAHVLRCSKCNSIFLREYLNMNNLEKYINGTTRGKLNQENLRKIDVLIPKSEIEQQKIADILSKVDEQIDFTEKIIDKTEELKKGLMRKLLTKGIGHAKFKKTELGEIPEEWEVVKIGLLLDDMYSGGTPSTKKETYWNGDIPWMTSVNINSDIEISKGQKNISIDGVENSSTKIVPKDNILFVTRVGLGKVAINKIDIAINQDITGLIVNKNKTDLKYLFWQLYLLSRKIQKKSQGTTIKGILKKDLFNTKVAIFNMQEQIKIGSILSKVDEQIQDNKKELNNLKELKKGLMQDLLTGKVRVSV